MQKFDLHMHTTYCDGSDSAEAMVRAAIERGLDTVGISGHSFTPHDTSYCMSRRDTLRYIDEVNALKEKYSGQIRVLLGIELDYYADTDTDPYDYIIGSAHYIFADIEASGGAGAFAGKSPDPAQTEAGQSVSGLRCPDAGTEGAAFSVKYRDWSDVDSSPEDLERFAAENGLGMQQTAFLYYKTVADIIKRTDCDIVGHFDLITKFMERTGVPDTNDPAYIEAWKAAVDTIFEDCAERYKNGYRNRLEAFGLIEAGDKPVFEINTGAISRGYRTSPYPSADQIEYIRSRGGVFVLSSDSHSVKTTGKGFAEYAHLL